MLLHVCATACDADNPVGFYYTDLKSIVNKQSIINKNHFCRLLDIEEQTICVMVCMYVYSAIVCKSLSSTIEIPRVACYLHRQEPYFLDIYDLV